MTQALRAVVIGGYGQDAICSLIGALPSSCGFAVLALVRDQPDLARVLRKTSKLPIVEAQPNQRVENDRVYVLPSDNDILLRRGELLFTPPTLGGVQLDRLLRSVADELGRDAVAVILGGLGTDGSLGIKRIKEAGGVALAEPPAEGPLGEMPRAAIASGAIDQVAPLEEIAPQLVRVTSEAPPAEDDDAHTPKEDTLRDILSLVRQRTGHDFGSYKRATLYRRVARRVQVCRTSSISEYHAFLRENPGELAHLLHDFLISVTNFFRDPDAFEMVARQIIPGLFVDRGPADQVRVWVAGCATGEEAYSLGMMLLEHAAKVRTPPRLQIFATDIDDDALAEGRAGRYPETIAVDVSPARLERFFVRDNGRYRVAQELRDIVLFSQHNLLRDPPFSRLDLVSCRNLLIYLNRDAQNRVFSMFHFGLRPEGYLFLGTSESADGTPMFAAVDPKYRLYSRRMVPTAFGVESILAAGRWQPPPPPTPTVTAERPPFGDLHHKLVERYAPPSILINGDLDIVHLSERAGKFLEIAGGEPTRQILRLVHPALRIELRTAIYAARQIDQGKDVRRIVFEDAGKRRAVELTVRSLDLPELGQNALLIYIDEIEPGGELITPTQTTIEPVVREMENELQRTRTQLRTTIEQYETSVEELKASNEELQAINEELRSATEELETSKEELQSVNEELTTLNQELKLKVEEVTHANGDLQNLMSSTDIGVVFLDKALNLKRFTPRALDLFNMIPSDIGRPLAHITNHLATDLTEVARRVLHNAQTIERDITSREGHRYLLKVLPYRSLDDRIEGVVLTFVDVSDLRDAVDARLRSEVALETSEARLRASLRGAPIVVLVFDNELEMTWGYALGKELSAGHPDARRMIPVHQTEHFVTAARSVIATGVGQRIELELTLHDRVAWYDMLIEPTRGGITAVGFDITSRKESEVALREADRRKDEFLATLSHELRNPLTPLKVALDVARLSGNDPAQLAKSQEIMGRQVTALAALVDELLDLSRITQGKIELAKTQVEVKELVDAAVESTRPMFADAKHELVVQLPPRKARVFGDPARLEQVLVNVLSNAAKYTPRGGHIKLVVDPSSDRKRVAIRVIDDGVGIAPEELPRIFEIFVQSRDSLGRSRGGLGIGLNLVKRIVELHGGSVAAFSEGADHGSEIVIELPLLPPL